MSSETMSRKGYKDPEAVEVQEIKDNVYRLEVDTSGVDEKKLFMKTLLFISPLEWASGSIATNQSELTHRRRLVN